MSQMNTVPVFKCKYCGKPVYVTSLRTSKPDPDAELLLELMRGLEKIAMCKSCQRKYNYMAKEGRSEEFIKGMLSPINLDNYKK
jgi:hypothetical protein